MTPPPTRFEITPDPYEEAIKAWNWFHTLTEEKPAVKSESRKSDRVDWFSNFLPMSKVRWPR
jgi:hypothetical protein